MDFFNFPTEIRLRIYSEVLVQDGSVEFAADYGPCNPPLIRCGWQHFCPAVLRVNKQMNAEAIPLLYSNNRFHFPDVYTDARPTISSLDHAAPYISPFLQQIGSNANLLRHICINFPHSLASYSKLVLHNEHIKVFQLIQDHCTGLRTIEISCRPSIVTLSSHEVASASEMLRMLDDGGFKAMSSLEKILITCGEYNIDDDTKAFYEMLTQRIPSSKWCIELIELPAPPPQTWISSNDMVEFDNYEDYCSYEEETERLERKEMEREERQSWLEEYYRRRDDPYWKNDSDYD
ncbi:hypothetical protein F4819DRAFT_473651 [Hypoxylon fuscum]|nr:hypothetical protein F4819DRAFT_473651 [Hypoxylon fuscum]